MFSATAIRNSKQPLEQPRVRPMRQRGAQGRGQQRHRDHDAEHRQVDRTDGARRRRARRHEQEAQHRGQRDHRPEPRRRCHCAVDRPPVQGQHRHPQRAAADPQQHADQPDGPGHPGPARARGRGLGQPPLGPAEQHVAGDHEHQHRKDQLQLAGAQPRHQPDAGHGAQHDPRRPEPQDLPLHRALAVMRQHRADRGDEDRRQRGRQADLHHVRPAIARRGQDRDEGRHQHDAAADPQQPGQDPGETAGQQQRGQIGQQGSHGHREPHAGPRAHSAPAPARPAPQGRDFSPRWRQSDRPQANPTEPPAAPPRGQGMSSFALAAVGLLAANPVAPTEESHFFLAKISSGGAGVESPRSQRRRATLRRPRPPPAPHHNPAARRCCRARTGSAARPAPRGGRGTAPACGG